ncbi:MAG: hypothetical protein WCJ28_02615 [Actinomycetota bacterium]
MVFVVLLGLWALVLAPTAYRWVKERSSFSALSSWEHLGDRPQRGEEFDHHLVGQSSTRPHLALINPETGRPEVAPYSQYGDAPIGQIPAMDLAFVEQDRLKARRRTALFSLLSATVGSAVLSFIPGMQFLQVLAFLAFIGLLGFVGFAFYITNTEAFADLLGRGDQFIGSYREDDDEDYAQGDTHEAIVGGYGYADGYDEADGYDDYWQDSRRAVAQ